MIVNEMERKIRELRQIQALIEEAQAEAENIKDELKAAMGDSEEIRVGEYRITWKPISIPRIDTASLRKTAPDIASKFTRITTSRRFYIQ